MSTSYVMGKLGVRFSEELEEIKINRIKNGVSKKMVGTERLTNMITRHVKSWDTIKKALENCKEEDIIKFGNGK